MWSWQNLKSDWKNKILIIFTLLLIVIVAIAFSMMKEKSKVDKYIDTIFVASEKLELDGALILAIIKTESDFNKEAVSSKNAIGLMQLIPKTAEPIATENGYQFNKTILFDPKINIELGSIYLKYLIEKFQNVDTAIAAYNAGEGNVAKWLLDEKYSIDGATLFHIPFSETESYVFKVKKYWRNYEDYYRRFANKANAVKEFVKP
ncbi:MAG: lytic transglycosylase domain-containing protein [Clostridia bacterium]